MAVGMKGEKGRPGLPGRPGPPGDFGDPGNCTIIRQRAENMTSKWDKDCHLI